MNHKSIVEFESEIHYRFRNTTIMANLDDVHFDAMNENGLTCMYGYDIDALEYIPAGSMRSLKPLFGSVGRGCQVVCERERTLAERLEAEKELEKILAELG
jgi:hypothetical protein